MTKKREAKGNTPPRPVRPLDPVWFGKFLTNEQLDKKKIKRIIAALNRYNLSCNKASEKFTQTLKGL